MVDSIGRMSQEINIHGDVYSGDVKGKIRHDMVVDLWIWLKTDTGELSGDSYRLISMNSKYKEHRWDLEQLIGSGGMPPSHSATVTALAVAVGIHDGLGGSTFATALILACIVMYDATGEGLHAGRQAEVLKQIVFELPAEHPLAESRPLRELLGHTPPQVLKKFTDLRPPP
ncbi:acid phosphatase/vanadium-dependent haloperoxidase protein-related protein [Tanacetum coccineum]